MRTRRYGLAGPAAHPAMTGLPQRVAGQAERYLQWCDETLGHAVEAVWVSGSIALGDFQPTSDLDLVVVTRRAVTDEERHTAPACDVVYTSDIPTLGLVERALVLAGDLALQGPDPSTVLEVVPPDDLSAAMRENASTYWAGWLRSARTLRGAAWTLRAEGLSWIVLGVPKQYATIDLGRIVSKSEGARYVRERFDNRWHRIIDEALRLREARPGPLYGSPIRRRADGLAFLANAIEQTLAL